MKILSVRPSVRPSVCQTYGLWQKGLNSPYFAFFSPNSNALLANYVTMIEDRLIKSANTVSQFQSSTFGHNMRYVTCLLLWRHRKRVMGSKIEAEFPVFDPCHCSWLADCTDSVVRPPRTPSDATVLTCGAVGTVESLVELCNNLQPVVDLTCRTATGRLGDAQGQSWHDDKPAASTQYTIMMLPYLENIDIVSILIFIIVSCRPQKISIFTARPHCSQCRALY